MSRGKSILVDIDAVAARHPALTTAMRVAARRGAALKLVDVLPDVPGEARVFVTSRVEDELVGHRYECLSSLAAELRKEIPVGITVEVLRGRPAVALVREVVRAGHELLVRSHGRGGSVDTPAPFGSIDIELLRTCPCAVWLVGPNGTHQPMRIAAAVHPSPDDPGQQALNLKILDLAATVAEQEAGRLTVVQAWQAFGEELLRARMTEAEIAQYVDAARQKAAAALAALLAGCGERLAGAKIELVNGEPHEAILAFAADAGIDLVVMGTVVRTGLPGFLFGNTAERVLRGLRCSVLAVKPDGFVSPVGLEDPT